MRKSKFTPEQIVQAIRQVEAGTVVGDVCRKFGVTEATLYRWKKTYAGLDLHELRELRQLRDENRRLKLSAPGRIAHLGGARAQDAARPPAGEAGARAPQAREGS